MGRELGGVIGRVGLTGAGGKCTLGLGGTGGGVHHGGHGGHRGKRGGVFNRGWGGDGRGSEGLIPGCAGVNRCAMGGSLPNLVISSGSSAVTSFSGAGPIGVGAAEIFMNGAAVFLKTGTVFL